MGGDQPGSRQNGLVGDLFSLKDDPTIDKSKINLDVFRNNRNQLDAKVYSSQLNVPTRRFTDGFSPQDGSSPLVHPETGEVLVEYFMLHYKSELIVSEEEEGQYQFALLSDDGSILRLDKDGAANGIKYVSVVEHGSTHPTRLECGKDFFQLKANTPLPIEVEYFQGPREHIALILLWRKVVPGSQLKYSYCGEQGNDLFFDYSKLPSKPKDPFKTVLSEGWQIIPPSNFLLPSGSGENPCQDGLGVD